MAKAFRYALKHSLPILISYIPVALAYGVLMQNCGYNLQHFRSGRLSAISDGDLLRRRRFASDRCDYVTPAQQPSYFLWAVLHRKIPYLRSLEIFSHLFPDG